MSVDFFIVGVQKGGTTALDTLLRTRRGITMASVKETHFFDDETRNWKRPDYASLHEWFPANKVDIFGEATPIYVYWPDAMERIAAYNPSAKIIMSLRHPSFRAHSHWRMETARGWDDMPFPDAIRCGRSRVLDAPQAVHRIFSYVERGFYAAQILRILKLFPRQQVLFLRIDDVWENPTAAVEMVCDFLSVPGSQPYLQREYVVPTDSRHLGHMSAEDRAYLDDLYAADIQETAQLTALCLDNWLRSSYEEPMEP